MIRKEPKRHIKKITQQTTYENGRFTTVDLGSDDAIWGLSDDLSNYYRVGLVSDDPDLLSEAQVAPRFLVENENWHYWLYRDDVYKTQEPDLQPEDVEALLKAQTARKKAKIARAKAVAAIADEPASGEKRKSLPQEVKVAVWQRDQGTCVECGSKTNLEFDHIIPLSMGGADTVRNLQILCADCNRSKGQSV